MENNWVDCGIFLVTNHWFERKAATIYIFECAFLLPFWVRPAGETKTKDGGGGEISKLENGAAAWRSRKGEKQKWVRGEWEYQTGKMGERKQLSAVVEKKMKEEAKKKEGMEGIWRRREQEREGDGINAAKAGAWCLERRMAKSGQREDAMEWNA